MLNCEFFVNCNEKKCRKGERRAKTLLTENTYFNWALKTGPGRIRTYDQGIMSPLRYRCATSPSNKIRISLTFSWVKYYLSFSVLYILLCLYSDNKAAPITPEKSPNCAFANLILHDGVGKDLILAICVALS